MLSVKSFLLVALIALGVGMGLGWWLHTPPPSASVTQAVRASRAAAAVAAKTDTIYRTDSTRAAYWFAQYDSLRRLPPRIVTRSGPPITVTHDSIVYVRADVADSAIHACRTVVSSCSIALAARDSVIASKDREIAARASLQPPRLSLYAAGLYDPGTASEVARVGGQLRLMGRVSLIGELEGTRTPRTSGDTLHARALVGAQYTFR